METDKNEDSVCAYEDKLRLVCDTKQIKSTVENSKEVNNHSLSLVDSDDDFRPLKKPTKQLSCPESQQSDSEDELLTHDEVARPLTVYPLTTGSTYIRLENSEFILHIWWSMICMTFEIMKKPRYNRQYCNFLKWQALALTKFFLTTTTLLLPI